MDTVPVTWNKRGINFGITYHLEKVSFGGSKNRKEQITVRSLETESGSTVEGSDYYYYYYLSFLKRSFFFFF